MTIARRYFLALIAMPVTAGLNNCVSAAPRPADAFPLVAQAVGARHTLRYVARQDVILLPAVTPSNAPQTGLTQFVIDVTRDGRHLRLVYWLPCDATNRVVVDDGQVRRQWEPAQRMVLMDRSHEETAAAGRLMLTLLHRNYRCVLLRREHVNGRWCDLVSVRPRRGRGPSRRLWIERSRHAILRTEEFDAAGQRRSLSFFETFRFVERVPAAAFSLPSAARRRVAPPSMSDQPGIRAAFTASGIRGRVPAWLPPGYMLMGCAVSGVRKKAAVLRYGDGLKTVSIFEEADRGTASAADRQEMLRRQMARIGQQAWTCSTPGLRITILGDVTLPEDLGHDLIRALSPQSEARLARGLAHDLNGAPAAPALRRRGWGYEQIAALRLYLRAHPARAGAVATLLRRGAGWTQVADALHADTAFLEGASRRWVAATINVP